jgi:hypothetical protein
VLSFLVRTFSRFYALFDRRKHRLAGPPAQPTAFGHDTNYPFF